MLRATTACNFSSLIWPAGSAPAALASLLFDPPELEKHSVSRLSYLFAHLHLLSSDSVSSTLLSSNLSLLSASSLLCFSSVHIVGSLTSKLPSTILYSRKPGGDSRSLCWFRQALGLMALYLDHKTMQNMRSSKLSFLGLFCDQYLEAVYSICRMIENSHAQSQTYSNIFQKLFRKSLNCCIINCPA